MVTIASRDGASFDAYLATPPSGRGPGLVVMQKIFGVNRVIRDIADSLASKGFVAIVERAHAKGAKGLLNVYQSIGICESTDA